ncbi:unnamed protein product, partial [Mesocestoides corti]
MSQSHRQPQNSRQIHRLLSDFQTKSRKVTCDLPSVAFLTIHWCVKQRLNERGSITFTSAPIVISSSVLFPASVYAALVTSSTMVQQRGFLCIHVLACVSERSTTNPFVLLHLEVLSRTDANAFSWCPYVEDQLCYVINPEKSASVSTREYETEKFYCRISFLPSAPVTPIREPLFTTACLDASSRIAFMAGCFQLAECAWYVGLESVKLPQIGKSVVRCVYVCGCLVIDRRRRCDSLSTLPYGDLTNEQLLRSVTACLVASTTEASLIWVRRCNLPPTSDFPDVLTALISADVIAVFAVNAWTDISDNHEVAIKLECVNAKHPQLIIEAKIYRLLQGG